MSNITVNIKRLDPTVELPKYAHPTDAGLDLRSNEDCVLKPLERRLVPCYRLRGGTMRCPKCGKAHTRVVDSRMQESNNTIKRRRECCSCNYRFTTFERCEDPIEVIKSDGTKQRFDRNKLLVGLMRATIKRDIDTKKLNEIIDDIEVELRSRTLTAVTSHELGDMVLKRLAKIDKVAYIRFASVYRDFKDVDEFLQELDKLR